MPNDAGLHSMALAYAAQYVHNAGFQIRWLLLILPGLVSFAIDFSIQLSTSNPMLWGTLGGTFVYLAVVLALAIRTRAGCRRVLAATAA